jgi:hypothetical protein
VPVLTTTRTTRDTTGRVLEVLQVVASADTNVFVYEDSHWIKVSQLMALDPQSPRLLYAQLADALRSAIRRGESKPASGCPWNVSWKRPTASHERRSSWH